ncbi:hypothetical protein LTR09_000451 [Extremus antarcticus]|uniref:Zn(2)-C6 fungal-type domain-containing protein n=1 Tax=Extremus antarcticus TaxID=702011 RepID=A0AAJ0GJT3_9PEZI|nr:hypothetical protein LTR09_000451 [Extremus antarcticus]
MGMSESSAGSHRRERAAIAAQACQTCRNRKSKCDEQRPKCGLCTRLNVECSYREPMPTKKDKTMVHILDTLTRLENKFDTLALSTPSSSSPDLRSFAKTISDPSPSGSSGASVEHMQDFPRELQQSYQHLTAPHKIILWPSIYIFLINSGVQGTSDLQYVLQEGTPWFIRQEMAKHPDPLPFDVNLPYFALNNTQREQGYSSNVAFPTLTIQNIREQCDAYFNTFNVLFPLLNRDSFMNNTVAPLMRDGYSDGDVNAVLALLVFALGQVAIDGVFERPIALVDGQPSGFRGGSAERPPGLAIFNEARRRIGFIQTHTSLENVQVLLLEATYYESTVRHLDFWRSTVAASMACQVLIKVKDVDWSTTEGDLIKRAFWSCILSEDFYHLDLDLPRTGIVSYEEEVPLPYFHDGHEAPTGPGTEERSHFQYHFLAMIALRRLIARINTAIHGAASETETTESYGGPPVHVIRELARQLDSWRSLLPRPLQWSDTDKFDFPATAPNVRRPAEPLFSPDQGHVPIGHKFNLDVVTAQLRTRFYYARFMMYRPFVYKALHFPELMSTDDENCCALAIKSACLWTMAMAPPKNKKRLVPHLFAWTQNFMGILLILRMTTENECLRVICEGQVNAEEIQRTAHLMLDWIKDVKQMDGIAEWSWRILEPLYSSSQVF